MATTARQSGDTSAVQEVAGELLPRTRDLALGMAEHLYATIPELFETQDDEFGSERERMLRSTTQLRAETVRAILAGEPVDEEAASRRLGYDLRRHHIALRVACASSAVRGLERAVEEAAAALGSAEPLVV